jgi:hypothetical protein
MYITKRRGKSSGDELKETIILSYKLSIQLVELMYKKPWLADCSDSCQISPTCNMYNFTVVSPTTPLISPIMHATLMLGPILTLMILG